MIRALRGIFPLTFGGVLLVVGSVIALWVFGFGREDLLLYTIGGLGLFLAVMSAVSVCFAAVRVYFVAKKPIRDDVVDAECGHPAVTGFSIPTLWWLPWVAVEWTWASPTCEVRPVRRRGRFQERVVPERRSESDAIVRDIQVSDAFGIARIGFRLTERRRFRALPNMGALEQVHVVQGLAGGDAMSHPQGSPVGDRFDMRHYTPGDPIRFVLWKVFAKSRDLVVRTPERAISPIQQTVAYLVASSGDEPAAGAARVVVGHGALGGDWTLGADGVVGEATTTAAAMDAIVKSAETPEDAAGTGLASFLANAPGGTRRAVVFVPPKPGPWLNRVTAAAMGRDGSGGKLDFIVCCDGIAPARRKGLARFLLADNPAPSHLADRDELREVVHTLSQVRSEVLVVDRRAGQVVPASHLRALGVA